MRAGADTVLDVPSVNSAVDVDLHSTEGQTPFWFGPEERPLFGWLHLPPGGSARGGVVLCPPLLREQTSAHFTYRVLAHSLAESGLCALRFDYDGTGDSAGDSLDPDRVDAWLGSIAAAVTQLRALGVTRVGLVGMRMGAVLAALSAQRTGDVSALVLWDPCLSGKEFLRRQRLAGLLGTTVTGSDLPRSEEEGPAPRVIPPNEFTGVELGQQTIDELGALRLPVAGLGTDRTLVVTRPDGRVTPSLFGESGGSVEFATAVGQEALLEVEPFVQQIPLETCGEIAGWLARTMDGPTAPVDTPARPDADVSGGGRPVIERAVRLGPNGLFGIETVPVDASSAPTFLFLNSGNDWHVGPHRLWVTMARQWAGLGIRSVRVDLSGLGDSPVRIGQPAHITWAPQAFEDVADLAAAVAPSPRQVALVGLCSGAYQALESAVDLTPAGVYAINPILHFSPPELADGPMDPRRRFCIPPRALESNYRRLLPGRVQNAIRPLVWTMVNRVERREPPGRLTGALRERGVDVLCVCGGDESLPFRSGRGPAPGTTGTGGPAGPVTVIDDLDHGLLPVGDQRSIAALLTEHVTRRFL